ncbi:MAG: hypothetical protein AMK73_00610 [Planctomycetes bacterium SM23_32]|nr:MAG: hypothetical protein AMK73_00610 [Planctomycetes bacterium SM23_32]
MSVEHVALAFGAPWTLVADRARNIYVLDQAGSVRGELRAGQSVRRLRAGRRGAPFTALAGQSIVYAFSAEGQLEWRVEFGGPVADFDADPAVKRLAAVSSDGWLHLYSTDARDRYVAPVGWPMSSVALLTADPFRVAVCDDKGRLAVLDVEAKVEWEKQLGCRSGPISLSRGAGLIAVPVYKMGVLLFDLNGQEAGRIDVGEGVRGAVLSAESALALVETEAGKLVVAGTNSSIAWAREPGGHPAAWALSSDGRMVVVAKGGREVVAYLVRGAPAADAEEEEIETELVPPGESAYEPELELEEEAPVAAQAGVAEDEELLLMEDLGLDLPEAPAAAEEPREEEFLEIESLLSERLPEAAGAEEATGPVSGGVAGQVAERGAPAEGLLGAAVPAAVRAGRRVAWKKKLPQHTVPNEEAALRLSADGRFLVAVLSTGRILVLDVAGEQSVRSRTRMPARLARGAVGRYAAVLARGCVTVLDLATAQDRRIELAGPLTELFDSAGDDGLVCTVDQDGLLSAFRPDGELAWQKTVKGRQVDLLVSPGGHFVLVAGSDGRFRFYDAEGTLVKKFRFAESEGHRALALGEGFSAFADAADRLTVFGPDLEETWSGRIFAQVTRAEAVGPMLAVYGPLGACAALDPAGGKVWEMRAPPGLAYVRWPEDGDPLVVHASGAAVTTFSGYKRKLGVVWRYTCDAEVTLLATDAEARAVVALAGDKLYRIERIKPV